SIMSHASSMPENISGASSPLGRQQATNQQAANPARSRFYGVLDGSISFGRRTTARLPRESATTEDYESEQYDFLALMTAVADLYSQDGILEMQLRGGNNVGKHIGSGAVSAVSSVFAAITRPSIVTSHQVKQRKHVVVLKKPAARLFLPNGRHGDVDALRGFISEIRVLSHKPLREHPNIIKILGVNWELESVNRHPRHQSLPFSTKKSIALDIACGLSALHQCGIVHGDVKPQNVLIFNKPALHAKIADFSHSIFDMGGIRRLLGGTWIYAAPEWEKAAPTAQLMTTDIYSYGLIFAGLILGLDLKQCIQRDPPFEPSMSLRQTVEKLKNEDQMRRYMTRQLQLVDQEDSDSDLAEFSIIHRIWENTIQLDPGTRSLDAVVKLLGGRERQSGELQRMDDFMLTSAISIPYYSLHQLSAVFMDHIEDALQRVAESPQDTRRAAAWAELAVCHASRITRHSGSEFGGDRWRTSTTTSLLNAAELGDAWARAVALRVSEALGQLPPERYDVQGWLFDAASKGSSIALESLVGVNRRDATEALRTYRQTFCGNHGRLYDSVEPTPEFMVNPGLLVNSRQDTVLHWIASVGNLSILQALAPSLLNNPLVNARNEQGDTPLLCATRAGHFDLIRMFLDLGADANLANVLFENPLHFLTCLGGPDVPQAARLLVDAGADPSAEATGYSGNTYLDPRPRGRSCPSLRAIFANDAHALDTLITLTVHSLSVSAAHEAIPLATQRILLAWALRLHHPDILEVLERHFGRTRLLNSLGQTYIWNNGRRYSLPELCIIGGVSASPASGFDISEPMFRIINHGRNYIQNLETSLGFLARHEPAIFAQPCGKARNALFFAIREGRADAVRFLASLLPWTDSLISKKKQLQYMLDAARREGGARSIISGPRSSQETLVRLTPTEDSVDAAADDGYEDPDEDSDLNTGSEVTEDACPHCPVRYDYRHRVYQKPGAKTAVPYHHDLHGPPVDSDPTAGGRLPSRPTNYRQMEGVVDAVLMAILYDRRSVLRVLLAGEAKVTLQRGDHFPCFVGSEVEQAAHYNDITVRAMAKSHDASNLVSYFPVQVWRSCVLVGNANAGASESFNGIIRYPVMYMTAIAMSIHRDAQLAKILVSFMSEAGMRNPYEWAAESEFESACLSISSPSFDEPPLYYAAARRWDELALLLMEHGASPRTPARWSVLQRLTSSPGNKDIDCVHNLLMLASQSGVEKIIAMEDVNLLLRHYPGFGRRVYYWDDEVIWRRYPWQRRSLSWKGYYEFPPADYVKLWEAISAANRAQQKKIRLLSSTRADADADDGAPNDPILAAAQRRDLVALKHLLDFDDILDVYAFHGDWRRLHRRWQHWDGWRRPWATALDVVSWTVNVDPSRCDESGLRLKAHDARIAALLIARGAARGPDYVFEALLAHVLLQHVVLPFVVLPLVGYCLYLSGVWTAEVVSQADRMRKAAQNQTSATDNVRDATMTMFVAHCVVAVGVLILMFLHFIHFRSSVGDCPQRGQTRSCVLLLWRAVWVILIGGALGNLITLSILGTGSEASKIFGASLLAFFSLEVCVLCIVCLLGLLGLAISLFRRTGRLVRLSKKVQNGAPFKYVWAATRSAFWTPNNGTAAISREISGGLARQWELDRILAR
ncbi:hypothetical protein C8A05DRAFT_19731, partial [Staphylotrichum tortipilum]